MIDKIMMLQGTFVHVTQMGPYAAHIHLMQRAEVQDGAYIPANSLTLFLGQGAQNVSDMDVFISTLIDLRIAMELENAKPQGTSYRVNIGKHTFIVDVPTKLPSVIRPL